MVFVAPSSRFSTASIRAGSSASLAGASRSRSWSSRIRSVSASSLPCAFVVRSMISWSIATLVGSSSGMSSSSFWRTANAFASSSFASATAARNEHHGVGAVLGFGVIGLLPGVADPFVGRDEKRVGLAGEGRRIWWRRRPSRLSQSIARRAARRRQRVGVGTGGTPPPAMSAMPMIGGDGDPATPLVDPLAGPPGAAVAGAGLAGAAALVFALPSALIVDTTRAGKSPERRPGSSVRRRSCPPRVGDRRPVHGETQIWSVRSSRATSRSASSPPSELCADGLVRIVGRLTGSPWCG